MFRTREKPISRTIFCFLYLTVLVSCNPTMKSIDEVKTAFGNRCEGVTSLSWQTQDQIVDYDKIAQIITSLTLAAEADAKKSEDLIANGNINEDINSEIARVIKENLDQGSSVSEKFWEQENRFGETMCLFLNLLDRSDISRKKKEEIIDDIRRIATAHNDYVLNLNLNLIKKCKPLVNVTTALSEADSILRFKIQNNCEASLEVESIFIQEWYLQDSRNNIPVGWGNSINSSNKDIPEVEYDSIVLTDYNHEFIEMEGSLHDSIVSLGSYFVFEEVEFSKNNYIERITDNNIYLIQPQSTKYFMLKYKKFLPYEFIGYEGYSGAYDYQSTTSNSILIEKRTTILEDNEGKSYEIGEGDIILYINYSDPITGEMNKIIKVIQ